MSPQPRTYSQLQPEDRVTLASLKQQNCSVREIASVLGRSASMNCAVTPMTVTTAVPPPSVAVSIGVSSPGLRVNCMATRSCLVWCSICCDSAGRPNRLP